MAQVDPDDDDIERFVVRRYAYDPTRRERRHIILVAYDNEQEFDATITDLAHELEQRRTSGAEVDPQEHISGAVLEPGHRRKQSNGRLLRHAIRHGATPNAASWDRLTNELPPNVGVIRFTSAPDA